MIIRKKKITVEGVEIEIAAVTMAQLEAFAVPFNKDDPGAGDSAKQRSYQLVADAINNTHIVGLSDDEETFTYDENYKLLTARAIALTMDKVVIEAVRDAAMEFSGVKFEKAGPSTPGEPTATTKA